MSGAAVAMRSAPWLCAVAGALALSSARVAGQASEAAPPGYSAARCPSCASWNEAAKPTRLFGATWYVGTRGLSALLLTSDSGHILIDGGLPETAPRIMASIRALGFRVEDVRLIVNSHAHYDHAGGIAALQRASGARVAASAWSAPVLALGTTTREDPQFELALPYPAVTGITIRVLRDGDTLRVGPHVITAHLTPGHTPGGTSWSWRACDAGDCRDFVYADSQTPVSADGFHFSRNERYPHAVADFERGFAKLEALRCDVLVTPHPSASQLWERLEAGTLRDATACARYSAAARAQLARRVARERAER